MKRSNWIYRFATLTDHNNRDTIDICTLTKGLVSHTLFISLLIVIAIIASFFLGMLGISILEILLNLASVGGFMLYFGNIGAYSLTLLFFAIIATITWYIIAGVDKLYHKEPGIVKIAYRSWKDKYCHIFTLED